jgi:integrase/recombinase XerD
MRSKIELKKNRTDKTFDRGFDEFILYCRVRNLRPTTLKYYNDIVNIWYKFCDYKTPIKDITKKTVDDFIIFLQTRTKENDVTVNSVLRGMRVILYYFMKLNYMEQFKIPKLKEDREVIETYSDAEIEILLEKPNLKECNYITYRNWVIINFFLAEGCRARTLVNIKIRDIDFENDLITYTWTKNRKQQVVPMANSLKRILIEYLQYRKGEADDFLFVNAYGDPLKVDQLSHNLADYNRRRGVMKTGVHRWRHTFSKMWIMNNGDIFRLQKMLGHSSLDVVKKYVDIFTNDLQKNFSNFNPLEQITKGNVKNHISMRGGRK